MYVLHDSTYVPNSSSLRTVLFSTPVREASLSSLGGVILSTYSFAAGRNIDWEEKRREGRRRGGKGEKGGRGGRGDKRRVWRKRRKRREKEESGEVTGSERREE